MSSAHSVTCDESASTAADGHEDQSCHLARGAGNSRGLTVLDRSHEQQPEDAWH